MRRLRYQVAVSLDGYIGAPDGSYDWIIMDPSIDFAAIYQQFDAMLMGRRTFEETQKQAAAVEEPPSMEVFVCSRTLRQADHPKVTILGDDSQAAIKKLKAKPGKDIWLFGGGSLFRSLLDAGLVDTIELAVIPVMLSAGVPLLPAGKRSPRLRLDHHEKLSTGIVMLNYSIEPNT